MDLKMRALDSQGVILEAYRLADLAESSKEDPARLWLSLPHPQKQLCRTASLGQVILGGHAGITSRENASST